MLNWVLGSRGVYYMAFLAKHVFRKIRFLSLRFYWVETRPKQFQRNIHQTKIIMEWWKESETSVQRIIILRKPFLKCSYEFRIKVDHPYVCYHRQPKRTICGFGLQRSFGRNMLELLVYYLMPNKCKNLKDMKSSCLSICTSSL